MTKLIRWSLLLMAAGATFFPLAAQSLRVSPDKRHLLYGDGTPFFYLGDTAWELFHRLDREEADLYLEDRAAKGFTVIQAVALAELNGLTEPNRYGHLPLENDDPTRPNEDYFKHVDYVVNKAEMMNVFIGLLPTWGDKWNGLGRAKEIFTPDNARTYGAWIGNRYKDKPVIWILGGDRNPETEAHKAIIRAMAEGIRSAVGNKQLITFHPMGQASSADFFHNDAWLDFNMFQSGHSAYNLPNYEKALAARSMEPPKPVLDGEPRYEDHPVDWKPAKGWFEDFDVRQAAYWSLLSGACGHTYGNHNIWQFYQKDRQPISSARTPWKEALEQPGAEQMSHLKDLFESRPWQKLVPDPSLVTVHDTSRNAVRAARADDGTCIIVYMPAGEPAKIDLSKISDRNVNAWWYNPGNGATARIGKFKNSNVKEFDPPGEAFLGNDWVLVLDAAGKNFDPPGRRREY
jgi:hypothetical protein